MFGNNSAAGGDGGDSSNINNTAMITPRNSSTTELPFPEHAQAPGGSGSKQQQRTQEAQQQQRRLVEYFLVVSSEPTKTPEAHEADILREEDNEDEDDVEEREYSFYTFGNRTASAPTTISRTASMDAAGADDRSYASGKSGNKSTNNAAAAASAAAAAAAQQQLLHQRPAYSNDSMTFEQSFRDEWQTDFVPQISGRYPLLDHVDNPLEESVTWFCVPSGQIVPLEEAQMPKVHFFVTTGSRGQLMYGTCLTLWESYTLSKKKRMFQDDGMPIETQVSIEVYLPKVLCLLSAWPFLTAFREFLTQLYRLSKSCTMTVPLERYVVNFCAEIPAPPPGAFEVQATIGESVIKLWSPPHNQPIPWVSLPFAHLFQCLDVTHVMLVWHALTLERQVLLTSTQLSLLTTCSEILLSLLFPMTWSHAYIPVLPPFMIPILGAPMPYLCGINKSNLSNALGDLSPEAIVVDLDKNVVSMGPQTPPLPALPQPLWQSVRQTLEESAGMVFREVRCLSRNYDATDMGQHLPPHLKDMADAAWEATLCLSDEAFHLYYTPEESRKNWLNGDAPDFSYSSADTMDGNVPLHIRVMTKAERSKLKKQSNWDAVQEAFFGIYLYMLRNYRKFLVFPTKKTLGGDEEDATPASHEYTYDGGGFQTQPFVRSQKFDMQPFLRELCQTQLFDNFVTKRLYNSGESDVLFVDHAIHTLYGNQTLLKQAGQALTPGAPQARKGLQQVGARFRRGNNSSERGSSQHKRSSSSTDASGSSRLLGGMGSLHGTLGKDVHAEPLLQSAAIRRKLKTVVPPEPTGYELPKPPPPEMRDAIQEYRLSEEGRETAGHVQHHDDDISVISTSSAGSYSLRSGRSGAARSTSDVTKPQEHRRTGSAGYYSARQRQEDETLYYYPKFPSSLDPELFGDPRPLSSAILAEFERQRADAIRFRRKRTHYTDEGALTDPSASTNLRQSSSRRLLSMTHDGSGTNSSDPFGQELHPFPEVATFSLFFQAFTALIGKELIEVAERPTYTDKDFIVSTFDYQKLKKEKAAKEAAAAAAAAAESEEDTTTAAATVSTLDHEEEDEDDDEDSPTTVGKDETPDVPTLSSPPRVLKQEQAKDDESDEAQEDAGKSIRAKEEETTTDNDDEDVIEGKIDDKDAQKDESLPKKDDNDDDKNKNKNDVAEVVADDNDQGETNDKSDNSNDDDDEDKGANLVDAISSQDTTTNPTSFDVDDALVLSDSNEDAHHKLNVSAISGSSSEDDEEEHVTDLGGVDALTKSTTNKFESTYFNESGRDRVSTRLRIRPSMSDDDEYHDEDDEEDISPSLRKGASFRFRSAQKARPRLRSHGSYNSDDDIYDDDVDLYRDDYDHDASSFGGGGRRGPSKLDMFTKNLDTSFGMNELTAGGLVPAPDDPLVVGDSADGDGSGASGQGSSGSSDDENDDDDDDDVNDDDTGERPKKWYDGVAGDYEDDNEVVPPLDDEEEDTSDMALGTITDAAGDISSSKDVETNDTEITTPVHDKADEPRNDLDDKPDEEGDTTDDVAKTSDKDEKVTKEVADTKDESAAESTKDEFKTNVNDTAKQETKKSNDDDDDDSHYKDVKLTQSQTTDEEGLEVELNPSSTQEEDDDNDNEEDANDDDDDNDDNGNDDEKETKDDENETKDDETKKDEENDLESTSNVVDEVALDGTPKKEDVASTVPEKGETTTMAPPTEDNKKTKSEETNKNKDDDATADDEACPEEDHPPPPPPPDEDDDDDDDDDDVPTAADVAPPIVVTDSAEAMALIGSPDRSGGRHVPSLTITTSTSSDGQSHNKSSSAQMADAEEYLKDSQRRVRSLVKTVSERALPLGKRIGEASGPVVKTVSERALLSPLGKRFSKLSRNKSETSGLASNDVSSILRSSAPPGTTVPTKSSSERSVKSTSLISSDQGGARSRFTDKLTVLELEEAKATAKAQLGLTFDILQMMRERGLKADPSVYQSLIGACGRCGDTERATQLLGRMHEDGIVADGVVYACLVSAFSQENAYKKKLGLQPNKANMPEWANNVTTLDMDWNSLRKRQSVAQAAKKHFQDVSQRIRQGLDEEIDLDDEDDLDASDGNFGSTTSVGGARERSVSPKKRKNLGMARFRKRSGNVINSLRGKTKGKGGKKDDDVASAISSSTTGGGPPKDELMVTEPVLMQLLLGENLLELVYPDILIEMDTETCPRCSSRLTDQDIVRGWKSADAQNYTTKCPSCYQRFVPHFSVQSSSPDFVGSRGPDTPLFCQRLSPWVLQKELRTVMMSSQMGNSATTSSIFRDEFLSKEWRHKETRNATLWWNLVVSFMRYRLPITFLLQDNFVGTSLIAPTPSFEDVEPLQPIHHSTPPQATNNCNDTVGGESKASGQFTASTMETSSTL